MPEAKGRILSWRFYGTRRFVGHKENAGRQERCPKKSDTQSERARPVHEGDVFSRWSREDVEGNAEAMKEVR